MKENRFTEFEDNDPIYEHALKLYNNTNKTNKRIIFIVIVIFIILDISVFVSIIGKFNNLKLNNEDYKSAVNYYEIAVDSNDIEMLDEASNMFIELNGFKDSNDYVVAIEEEKNKIVLYEEAVDLYAQKDYELAFEKFEAIIDYRDSQIYIDNMAAELYADAEGMIEEERYDTAKNILLRIPESSSEYYALAQEKYNSMSDIKASKEKEKKYNSAMSLYQNGNYEESQVLFIEVRKDYDVTEELNTIAEYYYAIGESCYNNGDYDGFFEAMDKIDSEREWQEYENVTSYIEEVKQEYKTYIGNTAETILVSQGYGALKEFVNGCVNKGFSQSDADSIINSKKPIMLSSLSPYDSWEFKENENIMQVGWSTRELEFDYGVRDVNGTLYSDVMMGGGYACAYYIGDSGYSMLTGSVLIIEGCSATVDKPVQLLICNDEGEILYRCELLSGYQTEYFAIDVSGEDKILIYFNGFEGHTLEEDDWYGGVGEFGFIK